LQHHKELILAQGQLVKLVEVAKKQPQLQVFYQS